MNKAQPLVVKGKLKLKGSASSSSGQSSKAAIRDSSSTDSSEIRKRKFEELNDPIETLAKEVHLTDAQKRFKQKQQEREKADAKKLVGTSYRERINQFNEKLSKLTEHNDIPRVSAAGNG